MANFLSKAEVWIGYVLTIISMVSFVIALFKALKAKKYDKIVELNNNSMSPLNSRTNARENDKIILDLCKKYEVPVVMGSDAHADFMIGDFTRALELVEEVGFPKELLLNDSVEKFKRFIHIQRVRENR